MILFVTPNPAVDRTLVVPQIQLDAVNRALSNRTAAGGKGVNAARAARTLGEDALCAGLVGGAQGALFAELARREGLAAHWTPIGGETRACTIVIDPAAGHNTVINEQGPLITVADWSHFHSDVLRAMVSGAVVCLCGSTPPGTSPNAYPALVAALRDTGLPVWVDVSGAPLAAVQPLTGVHLKINLDEAAALLHRPLTSDEDAISAATALSSAWQRTVVITLGANGAILASQRGRWHAAPPVIQRVNAVGSGDSLLAGLVTALVRGEDESTALAWGTAAGAANAAHMGGGSFTRSQFEAALAGVAIRPI